MKTWNKTATGDLTIATGDGSIDRVSAQFYNADSSAVEVTIKAADNTGGVSGAVIIKKFTLDAGETGSYHVNELESGDTVAVNVGGTTNLNIVTWN